MSKRKSIVLVIAALGGLVIAYGAYAWTKGSGSGTLCCKAPALDFDLFLDLADPRSNVTFVTNPPTNPNDPSTASANISGTVVGWEVPAGVCAFGDKACAEANGIDLRNFDPTNPLGFGDDDKGVFTLSQVAWSPVTFQQDATEARWLFILGPNKNPGNLLWTLTPTDDNGNKAIFCGAPLGDPTNCVLNVGIDVTKPLVNDYPETPDLANNVVVKLVAKKAGTGFSELLLAWRPQHSGFFDGSPVTGKIGRTKINSKINADATPSVLVDIQPGTCNNSLNVSNTSDTSVFPVAFLGTNEVDASQINTASIRVNGIAVPIEHFFLTDVSAPNQCGGITDGKTDLDVKFSRSDFIQAVAPGRVCTNGQVTVTFTGTLAGKPFEGTDTLTLTNCL